MVIIPYTDGLSSATVGMPIISVTDLGIVSDWYNGKYDIAKAYSS